MTEDNHIQNGWSHTDTEAFFATIGKYIIFFQYIEGILDQILLMGWEPLSWREQHAKLANLTNERKIDSVFDLVMSSEKLARARSRQEWMIQFNNIIRRLHAERVRRNSIVHSKYIFEFSDHGVAPPLRSKPNKISADEIFEQEFFSQECQENLLREICQLAIDVNFVHVQLIHDYGAKNT